MTKKQIWIDFLKKTVLTIGIAALLFLMFQSLFTKNGKIDYMMMWVCCGIPFGIRRMFVWIIPHGYDFGTTAGILALNVILGGLIGGFILAWRLLVAVWYIPLTVYRLATAGNVTPQPDAAVEEIQEPAQNEAFQ